MKKIRVIARLDIKGPDLIKGICLEGVRKLGDPYEFACGYYEDGVDEILYMDAVASLYGRNSLDEIVKHTAKDVFVPITVGGGIRSVEDAARLLASGADKVSINTAVIDNPNLIDELSRNFGSQAVVLSVEAKKNGNQWEAYTDNGREHTGVNVLDWVVEAQERGAGEILLTSVDFEGRCKGFDIELVKSVTERVSIPVIASGGMGSLDHLVDVVKEGDVEAVAVAHMLHYKKTNINEIKEHAHKFDIDVRRL